MKSYTKAKHGGGSCLYSQYLQGWGKRFAVNSVSVSPNRWAKRAGDVGLQSKREVERISLSTGPNVWKWLGIPEKFVHIEIRWSRYSIFLYTFAFGRPHDLFSQNVTHVSSNEFLKISLSRPCSSHLHFKYQLPNIHGAILGFLVLPNPQADSNFRSEDQDGNGLKISQNHKPPKNKIVRMWIF